MNTLHKSKGWKDLQLKQLRRQPLCVMCGAPASVVAHIISISAGGEPLALDNVESMCSNCYDVKMELERLIPNDE